MTNKQGDFIWYELITEDAIAAAHFYGPILGWTARKAGTGPDSYHLLSTGESDVGGMMDLPADAKANGMRPNWLGYVAVDDVDAAAAKIVADGGTQHMPPMDIPNVGRFAMLADPQGASFYVMRGAMEGTSNSFAMDKTGHCHWNELATSDQAAAWSFYGNQFGWIKGDVMSMGPMGDYEFLTHAGQTIGAFAPLGEVPRPEWTFYFGVADIDEAATRVKDGGGTISYGPAEVPGGMFIIVGVDPQGAQFGLVGPRNS